MLRRFSGNMFLVATLAASLGLTAAATAQNAEAQNTTHQDWVVTCTASEAGQSCAMVQRLNLGDGGAQMSLEMSLGPDGSAVGVMIAPFGLDIAKGVSINIDGGPRFNLPFRTCRQFGCVVRMNFGAEVVALLRRGATLQATLYQLDGNAELNIPFSLNGFSSAFANLQTR